MDEIDQWNAPLFRPAEPYLRFVREERHFCAVLAHLLVADSENVQRLLTLIRERLQEYGLPSLPDTSAAAVEHAEIYLEFAFLRDRWNQFDLGQGERPTERNARKCALLFALFGRVRRLDTLKSAMLMSEVAEFNARFMGPSGLRVRQDIASPALWRVPALLDLAGSIASGDPERKLLFRDLCRFKWAFRIKPDMVVVVPGVQPLCVEAKLMSPERRYPTDPKETRLFDALFEPPENRVRQIELQDFLFRVLLGVEAQKVLISQGHGMVRMPGEDGRQLAIPALSWRQVFDRLDGSSSVPYVASFLRENMHIQDAPLFVPGHGSAPGVTGRYFDGTANDLAGILALLAERQQAHLRTQVGFRGGLQKLQERTLESLVARKWKWRDPDATTGKVVACNWIAESDFERAIEGLQQAAATNDHDLD
jgi:hypothetical protein